jgi:hypothetical protein
VVPKARSAPADVIDAAIIGNSLGQQPTSTELPVLRKADVQPIVRFCSLLLAELSLEPSKEWGGKISKWLRPPTGFVCKIFSFFRKKSPLVRVSSFHVSVRWIIALAHFDRAGRSRLGTHRWKEIERIQLKTRVKATRRVTQGECARSSI